jgi:hypothetical protein
MAQSGGSSLAAQYAAWVLAHPAQAAKITGYARMMSYIVTVRCFGYSLCMLRRRRDWGRGVVGARSCGVLALRALAQSA